MRNYLLLAIQLLFFHSAISQQKEGNWWFFGQQSGVEFSSGSAQAHLLNQFNSTLGAASISDENGNLLFYTNGSEVYNRLGQIMSNGNGISPPNGGVVNQGRISLISKYPQDKNRYFLFVIRALGNSIILNYSEIDIRLNNGFGDVVSQKKNVLITNNCAFMMGILSHQNNLDYWFIIHEQNNNNYRIYKIDSNGFNMNFSTYSLGSTIPIDGRIKTAPNSSIFSIQARTPVNKIEVLNFDRATGVPTLLFSDFQLVTGPSAGAFSPNSSNFYYNSGAVSSPFFKDTLFQVDLTFGIQSQILSTKQIIKVQNFSGTATMNDFQVGLNGKLYFILRADIPVLSEISCPNEIGLNCNYQDSTVNLLGRNPGAQLPTLNQTLFVNANILQAQADKDTICLGDSINLSAFGAGADSFQWVKISGPGPTGLSSTTGGLIKASPQVGTHVYSAVGFKTCGAPDTATVRLVVVPAPVANAGPDQTACRGDSLQLGSTASTGIYRWARMPAAPIGNLLNDSTVQRPFFRSALANPSQNQFRFVLQARNAGCSRTDTVQVNLNNLPTALNLAGPDTTKCSTAPIQLGTSPLPSLSYQWGLVPTGLPTGLQNANTAQPLFTFVPPGTATNPQTFTYRLQVTDSNGCQNADTVQVVVRPVSKRLAGADLSFCSGDSAKTGTSPLPALTGVVYRWRWEPINHTQTNAAFSDTTTARPFFTATHSDSVLKQYRLIVRGSESSVCTNTDTAIATVNPLPTADSVFTFTTCSGVPLTLSVPLRANYSYLWKNSINSPLSILNSFSTTFFNSDTISRTDTLLLTLTDTLTGCTKTVIRLVRINPLPRPDAGPDSLICSGDTINIGSPARANLTYQWSPSTGIQSPSVSQTAFTATNNANSNQTQTRIVLATDSLSGCQNRDTVRITVSGVPRASITGPTSVCPGLEGAFYTLNGLNPFTTIAQGWQVQGGQIDSSSINAAIINWDSIPTDSARVILIPTNARGCKGDTARLTVRINKELATETPNGDTVICSGTGNRTYSIQNTTGSSYFWQAAGTTILSGQGSNSVTIRIPDTLSLSTTFSVWVNESTITRTDTCLGNSDTLQITVNPSPVRRSIFPESLTTPFLCANDTIAVNLSGLAISQNSSYNWQVLSTQANLIAGQGNDTASIRLNASTTGFTLPIRVRETSDKGCLGPQIDTVLQISPQPIAQAGADSTVCSGDSLQLGDTAQVGTTYLWSPTTNLSNPNSSQPVFSTNNFGISILTANYLLSTQNTQGCRNRDSVTIIINPEPAPGAQIAGPAGWCSTDTVVYTLNPTGIGSTLVWSISPVGTLQVTALAQTITLINTNPQDSGVFQIKVLETNPFGCSGDTISRTISLFPQPRPQLSGDSIACEGNSVFEVQVTNPNPGSTFNWNAQQGQINSGQGTANVQISFNQPFGNGQTRILTLTETTSQGCQSDTVSKIIYLDGSNAEIIRATTLPQNERQVEVLYQINNAGLTNQLNREYELERSINSNPFELIFSSSSSVNRFAEATPLGYPAEAVQYRLSYLDACNTPRTSSVHNLIQLSGRVTEAPFDQSQNGYQAGTTQLDWNSYEGWSSEQTEVYRTLSEALPQPPLDPYRTRINAPWEAQNGSEAFTQTYRIKAQTEEPNDTVRYSWSNSLRLSYQNPLKFFNLVTPNGDGQNETFIISNVQLYDHRLTILDRWGRTVLQTNSYNNDWSTQVGGTYFYRLENKTTGEEYSGWVQVVE